jgi:hypothetical protein
VRYSTSVAILAGLGTIIALHFGGWAAIGIIFAEALALFLTAVLLRRRHQKRERLKMQRAAQAWSRS